MLSASFVKSIANQNLEVILDKLGLEYKLDGGWITLRCMFHGGEKFNLKFRGESFYCFSECRRQYDIFEIVSFQLNINFRKSIEWVADVLEIEPDKAQKTDDNVTSKTILSSFASIKKNRDNKRFMPLDESTLQTIKPAYPEWLNLQGFTKDTCDHFDICLGTYGALRDRVCFPIDSPDGTIISVSGRMPYYESLGVSRYHIVGHSMVKNTLYNISRISKELWNEDTIIVVEGFKSVMRLYQEGYKNSVATIGASLSEQQKNLLLKTGIPITVIADNDKVGECFAQSIYNKCNHFSHVNIINLSDITGKEKASVDDLNFDEFLSLEERLNDEI